MKKLLVIGVLMSVMLVGCGTQKETDSTVSTTVAEAVTEVLTETTEAIEETTTVIEEETTEEETTVVEETTVEVVEEVVEEVTAEEPAPAVEEPAPAPVVEEAPVEEPAPEVAPATTGTTVTVTVLTAGDDATVHADIKNIVAGLGFSVTNYTVLDEWYTAYTVNVSTADDYNKVWQAIYDACYELK